MTLCTYLCIQGDKNYLVPFSIESRRYPASFQYIARCCDLTKHFSCRSVGSHFALLNRGRCLRTYTRIELQKPVITRVTGQYGSRLPLIRLCDACVKFRTASRVQERFKDDSTVERSRDASVKNELSARCVFTPFPLTLLRRLRDRREY